MNTRLSSQKSLASTLIDWRNMISKLTEECNNEVDINKKIQLLYKINSILPNLYQLNIPSLVTDDYIDTALYRIYQNMEKPLQKENKINL
jgi:hypothetical protein